MAGAFLSSMRPWPLIALLLAEPAAAATRVLVLGDSLAAAPRLQKAQTFPALLEKELRREGYQVSVINAGQGGATSATAAERLRIILEGSKPDLLLLELGGNDGLRRLPPDLIRRNLEEAVKLAQEHGIQTVIAGLLAPAGYDRQDGYVQAFEDTFAKVASDCKVPLIPSILMGVIDHPELMLEDGIHPNAAGHRQMARTVLPFVKDALAQSPSTSAANK